MIHRVIVSIIFVVSCYIQICDAFFVVNKSYLPATNLLQKKRLSNNVFRVNTSKLHVVNNNRGIELSNVFYDDADMAFSAWEWQNGLGELVVYCVLCDGLYDTLHQLQIYTAMYLHLNLFFQSSRCTCGIDCWCRVSNINGNT